MLLGDRSGCVRTHAPWALARKCEGLAQSPMPMTPLSREPHMRAPRRLIVERGTTCFTTTGYLPTRPGWRGRGVLGHPSATDATARYWAS
eukprot:3258867-Pyramimonas_sp.AAC.1